MRMTISRLQKGSKTIINEGRKKGLFKGAALFICALLIAKASFFSAVMPFGVAFAAAASPFAVLPAIGAMIGYLSVPSDIAGITYAACVLVVLGFRRIFAIAGGGKKRRHFLGAAVAGICCFAAVIISRFSDATFFTYIFALIDGIICAAACLLLKYAASGRFRLSEYFSLPFIDIMSVTVAAAVALLALSEMGIWGINLGALTAAFITFACAAAYGPVFAGAIGAAMGGVLTAGGGAEMVFSICALAAAGFAVGYGFRVSKTFAAATGLLISGLLGIMLGGAQGINFLAALFFASILFFVLPEKYFESVLSEEKEIKPEKKKLFEIAAAFEEIAKSIKAKKEDNLYEITVPFERAADRVCKFCGKNAVCFGEKYYDSMNAFNALAAQINTRELTGEDFSGYFPECKKTQMLAQNTNGEFQRRRRLIEQREEKKTAHAIFGEQFESIAAALSALSGEQAVCDIDMQKKIEEKLKFFGISASDTAVFCKDGAVFCEICLPRIIGSERSAMVVREIVAKETGKDFPAAQIIPQKKGVRIVLQSMPEFKITVTSAARNKHGESCCGDTNGIFDGEDGKKIIVLSDGMGSGKKAAEGSVFAVSFLKKLLLNGIGEESAMKIINIALMARDEESFATCDIAIISGYSGEAELIKAGAAPSFLARGDEVYVVESHTMPSGIMPDAEAESVKFPMAAGDRLIMVSDGVIENGDDPSHLIAFIKSAEASDSLAEDILDFACRGGAATDDMTCIVAEVASAKTVKKRPVYLKDTVAAGI